MNKEEIFKSLNGHVRHLLGVYSPEPRAEVYCVRGRFPFAKRFPKVLGTTVGNVYR